MQILSDRRLKKHIVSEYDMWYLLIQIPSWDICALSPGTLWRYLSGVATKLRTSLPWPFCSTSGPVMLPGRDQASGKPRPLRNCRHRDEAPTGHEMTLLLEKEQQRFLPSKNNDLSRTYVCLSIQMPHENNWTELKKTENGPIFERYFSRLTAQVSLNQDLLWSPFEKRVLNRLNLARIWRSWSFGPWRSTQRTVAKPRLSCSCY